MPELETPTQPGRSPAAPLSPEPPSARKGLPLWFKGLAPLALLAGLVFLFLRVGPVGVFRATFPPVEELTLERIRLPEPGVMEVSVVNGGPQAVTIAQIMVDDANWVHTVDGSRKVERLERRTVRIPYPWVEGEPLTVAVVTNTGLTFSTEIAVATQSPAVDARYLGTFALLGVYAGVIPVFIGLLWLPFVRSVERRWIDFFLSLTIGLLVFLGVDALEEALATSAFVPGAFQGLALVVFGLLGTPLVIGALGEWRARTRGERSPLWVAALIAFGIGLHNLGEGLAIGTSYATGEIALGTFLVIGFLLHNTTEGLGIVTPLAGERPRLPTLLALGALAGVPTVIGAWIGGFTYSPIWTTLFFAVGAGAIVLVVYELWQLFARRSPAGIFAPLNAAGVLIGMLIMYATGLLVTA
jgi:zinc transporter, ZIP family